MMSEILTDEHQNNHVHWWHRTVILPPQQITNDRPLSAQQSQVTLTEENNSFEY